MCNETILNILYIINVLKLELTRKIIIFCFFHIFNFNLKCIEEIESLQQQLQQVKITRCMVGVQFDYLIPQSGMFVCVCTGSRYDVSVLFQI